MKKIAATLALMVLLVSPAWAHKVCMLSSFEGDSITGEAYFSTGDPIVGSPVTVESNGEEIGQGKTDENGAFSIAIPKGVLSAKVTINAGMGHVAHEDIAREGAPEPSTATEPQAQTTAETSVPAVSLEDVKKAVASEIAPVKKMVMDMERAQSKPDMPKILGGIGYIIGIVGAFMWGRSKRV